jgi:hypothetical protein
MAKCTPGRSRPGTGRSRGTRAPGGDDDRVVPLAQVIPGDVDPDVDARAEPGALGRHLGEAQVEVLLLHLEVGDAVAQQAADAVVALEDRDGVTRAGELLRGREPGGPRADDGHGLARQAPGRLRLHPAVAERLVDDRDLDLLDRDRRAG